MSINLHAATGMSKHDMACMYDAAQRRGLQGLCELLGPLACDSIEYLPGKLGHRSCVWFPDPRELLRLLVFEL